MSRTVILVACRLMITFRHIVEAPLALPDQLRGERAVPVPRVGRVDAAVARWARHPASNDRADDWPPRMPLPVNGDSPNSATLSINRRPKRSSLYGRL